MTKEVITRRNGKKPNRWITGPDELRHEMYSAYRQQKNQAQYRGEVWDLPFDDWISLWGNKWQLRGRTSGSYSLTRKDRTEPWNVTNAVVMQRGVFYKDDENV